VGFYRIIPDVGLTYGYPIDLKRKLEGGDDATVPRQQIADWMQLNNHLSIALHRYVNFLCPQAYVQYSGDQEEWRWSTALQILEAVRLSQGKSVYPIVWFNAQTTDTALTRNEFVSSLKFVLGFPGVDGIIVFDGGDVPTEYKWQDVINDVIQRTGDFAIQHEESTDV
jgi:hypothetical protein